MKILSKQQRLAEALKKNLAKRKEQRRERDNTCLLPENELAAPKNCQKKEFSENAELEFRN